MIYDPNLRLAGKTENVVYSISALCHIMCCFSSYCIKKLVSMISYFSESSKVCSEVTRLPLPHAATWGPPLALEVVGTDNKSREGPQLGWAIICQGPFLGSKLIFLKFS